MDDSPIRERLIEAAGRRNFRHLGDLTGTSHENVRRYLKGLSAPSVEFLARFCAALGINGDWLLTGRGPMLREEIRPESLRQANAGELLGAMAATIERIQNRIEVLERWMQDLEIRVRAEHARARARRVGSTHEHQPAATESRVERSEDQSAAVAVPERVQRTVGAVARRSGPSDR